MSEFGEWNLWESVGCGECAWEVLSVSFLPHSLPLPPHFLSSLGSSGRWTGAPASGAWKESTTFFHPEPRHNPLSLPSWRANTSLTCRLKVWSRKVISNWGILKSSCPMVYKSKFMHSSVQCILHDDL